MTPRSLRRGDVVRAETTVAASPEQVYDVVSDIRRIPEWSPECIRAEWTAPGRFRGTNRRRFGRWSTHAYVVTADPGRGFAFTVLMGGADFTTWTYSVAPAPGGCLLTEEMRMCVDLPLAALLFERIALRVKDRRSDLQGNLDASVRRIRDIVHAGSSVDPPGGGQ